MKFQLQDVEEDEEEGEGEALERPAGHEGQAEQGNEGQGQPLRKAVHQGKAQGRQQVSRYSG